MEVARNLNFTIRRRSYLKTFWIKHLSSFLSFLVFGFLGFLSLGFQLVEQIIQPPEGCLPELTIFLQPSVSLCQRFRHKPARPPLRVAVTRNETSVLENP